MTFWAGAAEIAGRFWLPVPGGAKAHAMVANFPLLQYPHFPDDRKDGVSSAGRPEGLFKVIRETRLVVFAALDRTSPKCACRDCRMTIVIAGAIAMPKATLQKKRLPLGGRVVDQAGVVVTGGAPGFAVPFVNIGITSANVGPAAVSEEHLNA